MELPSLENISKLNRFEILLLTVLGLGKIKFAPGTFGSLAAVFFIFVPDDFIWLSLLFIVLLFIISLKSVTKAEKILGSDPSIIVLDEFIAMGLIYSIRFYPPNIIWYAISFILFRLFDIFKPFPINLLNEKKGSIFVFADDILAAIFSLITLFFLNYLYNLLFFWIILLKY